METIVVLANVPMGFGASVMMKDHMSRMEAKTQGKKNLDELQGSDQLGLRPGHITQLAAGKLRLLGELTHLDTWF